MNMQVKTKKTISTAIISLFIISMLSIFATVPLASAVVSDLTPTYAKAGSTIDILSSYIVGPAGGTTLTSVTIAYTGTSLADLSWAAIYVSTDGGVTWTLFGWVWAASLTGTPPTGTITPSTGTFIGECATAMVKLAYTLSTGAVHGRYVDGRVTTYTLSMPPGVGTDVPPIDPTVTVGIPAYLESGGDGVAEWTTDEKKYENYSVGLTMPSADDYAEVWVPVSIPLGDLDLSGTYFWCKVATGGWTPYFIFETNASYPGNRINTDAYNSAGYADWNEYYASDSPQFQWADGTWHSHFYYSG